MPYISSNANRWYCAKESAYGHIPAITAANRIPAVAMTAQHKRARGDRKDKTGSRTWPGVPQGMRHETNFSLTSYMRDWADMLELPPQGPLFQAALGAEPVLWPGGSPVSGDESTVAFLLDHGLNPGQAVTSAGEIRFVANVVDSKTVVLNAPFSTTPVPGLALGATATYSPAPELPSVSLFDYWDPTSAVQRVISGGAIDRFTAKLNGDFHEFEFKGLGQDIVDSASFLPGQGSVATFPAEPARDGSTYSPVPGNLGQIWLGVIPTEFFTISAATIDIQNHICMRDKEYGFSLPQGINPGERDVRVSLELFSQNDQATTALYQAARQQVPISLMFQMGQVGGQLMGIYLKSLIPEVPEFNDTACKRLQWRFRDTRAQGTSDDEIVVAFG